MQRRHFLTVAAASAAMGLSARAASRDGPLRVVLGFPPGGSVDGLARVVADILASALGRPAVVENKPGAAGRIAVEAVKEAAADGDTLLVSPQGPMTLFPYVFKTLRFDPAKDFTPIVRLGISDLALSVGPMVGARDLPGTREWLRSAGERASFGSPGAGTIVHFAGVAAGQSLGLKMVHVPYQGSAKSMIDLAGGNIATVVSPVTEALELHKSGRIRMVATLGRTRSTFVPEVPTLAELGYDVDIQGWNAVYAPARLDPQAAVRLVDALRKGLASPAMQQRMAALGVVAAPLDPLELEALRRRESALWEGVVRSSGFTPEA